MGSSFLPDRCALVDTVGSNYLIRGNMPLLGSDKHYAYKEIELASKLNLRGKTLVEIPIIDNVGEREEFSALYKAFGLDPDKYPPSFWPWWTQENYNPNALQGIALKTEGLRIPGSIIWRPFEGLPENGDANTFLKAPGWDFGGFVDLVGRMLATMKNLVIYVHCELGADRTGAFHIGYLMRVKGKKFTEAFAMANSATKAGPPNADYIRLVEAYAKLLSKA